MTWPWVFAGLHPRQPAVVVVAALAQLAQGQARLGPEMTQHHTEQPAGDRPGIYRHTGPLPVLPPVAATPNPFTTSPPLVMLRTWQIAD